MTAHQSLSTIMVTETLKVQQSSEGIMAAQVWLEGLQDVCEASEAVWHAMTICLEECVTNVVHYADPDGSGIEIDVIFRQQRDGFQIEVIDTGFAFNPLQVETAAHDTIDTVQPGGQGINLIRSLTASCSYARIEGRNHLSMIFAS